MSMSLTPPGGAERLADDDLPKGTGSEPTGAEAQQALMKNHIDRRQTVVC
jgi:hypothetical protein